ncbi:bile acid:sodium symporter family protein [Planctobacterium marinum]|uniref:bile acid:sodium symporter family protein n=1 Tax=Planctobacterium marinum TaxID=1631968 RepID=UPI0030C7141C
MKIPKTSKNFLLAAIASFIMAAIFGFEMAAPDSAFSAVLGGLILLSLALHQIEKLRDSVFTLWVFVAFALGLLFPESILQLGSFETKSLIIPLLMVIMFGMGCTISLSDFARVIAMPKAVSVGLICQFTLMPLMGFLLAYLSNLPSEIAAGIILVGCSPSGLASNVMAFVAKANVALSLTLTAIATLIAPFITPLLMRLLADELVEIDALAMFFSMLKIVILPVVAGLIVNRLMRHKVAIINRTMPLVSMVGIVVIIAIIVAAGQTAIMNIGMVLILIVLLHNLLGFALGYGAAKLLKLEEQDARSIAFEVGMQNSGLASGIALAMNKLASMGLAPAFFSPVQNITGSTLATYWRNKSQTR